MVLAIGGGLVAGCSSGGDGGQAGGCQAAREKFQDWYIAEPKAHNAAAKAQTNWTDATLGHPQGQALTEAIDRHNADLKNAQAARARADQRLAAANAAIATCDQSKLPVACQSEFAQYKPIMDNEAAETAADSRLEQIVAEEQQALMSGNFGAYDTATSTGSDVIGSVSELRHNGAQLFNAYDDALRKCNDATTSIPPLTTGVS